MQVLVRYIKHASGSLALFGQNECDNLRYRPLSMLGLTSAIAPCSCFSELVCTNKSQHSITSVVCLQLLDDHGVPLADTAHPELQTVAETDLVGPDSKPTDDMGRAASIAIPLERQISFKFPTVITPSEQAEDVRHIATDENGGTEQVMTAKQAATAYAGEALLLHSQSACQWLHMLITDL